MLISVAIALLVAEGAVRILLNPADYLSVTVVPDEILGIRVPARTAGFDEWGFRNPRVPRQVEIVAIGDSHTYGHGAQMFESWPYVVSRLTGGSVYNLSLGGYGPNQYFYLFETRALLLKPHWVICGLYMGDDFENAFLITYGKNHWAFLRKGQWDNVDPDIWKVDGPSSWHERPRQWLSRNSVVYQIVVHGPVLGGLKGMLQIKRAADGAETTSLILPDAGIQEAFRPLWIRRRLNQQSPAILEGMRITFELLERMKTDCRNQGCRFAVVVIPTKEMVFADYLRRIPDLHLREAVADVLDNEAKARHRLFEFLDKAEIPYVDPLPLLRSRAQERLYTRSDRDMHPGKNGYRIIGEAVAEFLKLRGDGVSVRRPGASNDRGVRAK